MLKHIVCWKVKDAEGATREENIKKMKVMLDTLPAQISEIKAFEVGVNFNPADAAYDISLYSGFENQAGLDIYQQHPEHQKVVAFFGKVVAQRVVVDYFV